MVDNTPAPYQDIYAEIKEALLLSRNQAYSAVNFAMVQAQAYCTSDASSWSMSKTEASGQSMEKVSCRTYRSGFSRSLGRVSPCGISSR